MAAAAAEAAVQRVRHDLGDELGRLRAHVERGQSTSVAYDSELAQVTADMASMRGTMETVHSSLAHISSAVQGMGDRVPPALQAHLVQSDQQVPSRVGT